MDAFKQLNAKVVAIETTDIDTDQIIPAIFLKTTSKIGLGKNLFSHWRYNEDGSPNEEFIINKPEAQGAQILLAGDNFGCGSSREHAPQSIMRWGISAIVGESFAEIFLGNCVAIGIPCVTANPDTIAQLQTLITDVPGTDFTLDLTTLTITGGGLHQSVTLNEGSRQMFINGTWDACGQLLSGSKRPQRPFPTLVGVAFEGANRTSSFPEACWWHLSTPRLFSHRS